MSDTPQKPIIVGISQGDINGIGLEVIIKTFSEAAMLEVCTPVLFSSNKTITAYRKFVQVEQFDFNLVTGYEGIAARKFNLFQCYNEEISIDPGKSSPNGGKYALASLFAACHALDKGKIDALVTAPINKGNTMSTEFPYSGHTPFFDAKFSRGNSLMMLVAENLRVALVTEHIPVAEVAAALSQEKIIRKISILCKSLRMDFGIEKPKIALLGLNPHAGDGGTLGKEENEIIVPALKKAVQDTGAIVLGPYSADGFFASGGHRKFDAALAMYHDQGLIPFKQMAFDNGVNFTAGLPIIRTSPDHGTAFDIAGKNRASENSFRAAIFLACDIAKARKRYGVMTANPLKQSPITVNQRDE